MAKSRKSGRHSRQMKILKLVQKGKCVKSIRKQGKRIFQDVVNKVVADALEHPDKYFSNPEKDFTRDRKMTLPVFVRLMFHCCEESINKMISGAFEKLSVGTDPTRQAFYNARRKVSYLLFERIFREFAKRMEKFIYDCEKYSTPLFHQSRKSTGRFKIFAVDGSDFKGRADPSAVDAYHMRKNGSREYNLYHFNAMYNVMSGIFVDGMVKGKLKDSERYALLKMVEKMPESLRKEAIILADRGYPSLEVFRQLILSGVYFIMRTVKPDSNGATINNVNLPENQDSFDVTRTVTIRKHKGEASQVCPDGYPWRILANRDCANPCNYAQEDMTFRIVKVLVEKTAFGESASDRASDQQFIEQQEQGDDENVKQTNKGKKKAQQSKDEDSYVEVYLVTNIPDDVLPEQEIADLYTMRWRIETAFGQLKQHLNGEKFFAVKHERIYQELWAKLTLFNYIKGTGSFFEMEKARIYQQKVNFLSLKDACLNLLWKGDAYKKFEYDACRDPVKIRPGRHEERKMGNNNSKPKGPKVVPNQEKTLEKAA